MISFIAALIVVIAGCVAVLQFFLAFDGSVRSAAETTWVFRLSRWCAGRLGGLRERFARTRRRREEPAVIAWPAEARPASRRSAHPAVSTAALPAAEPLPRRLPLPLPPPPAPEPGWPSFVTDPQERRPSNGAGPPRPPSPATAARPASDRSHARPFSASGHHRAHWIWATRPDFYAEADGSDRVDLEPSDDYEPCGWWTCDEATQRGDLVVVYRSAPRKDLCYLIEAESDAFPLDDDLAARLGGGLHGCDYRVLHKLDPPIPLTELRSDPVMARWPALRVQFQRRLLVPPLVWERLVALLERHDPRARQLLRELARRPPASGRAVDRTLEGQLSDEPERLRRIGLDAEVVGRQIRDPNGGIVDLLLRDKGTGDYVVVAVEPGRGARGAVTQLLEHVAAVPELLGTPHAVRGLLVAADLDHRTELMVRGAGNLDFARLDELGLSARRR